MAASANLRNISFYLWVLTALVVGLGLLLGIKGYGPAGTATLLLAALLASQAWRMRNWAQKLERSESERETNRAR